MSWTLDPGLRFGRLVIAAAIGLVVIGAAQMRSAPVDVYPQFTPPSVEVQTEALGLSAAEVEQLITVPLEQDLLNGVPWLDRIHSSSVPGLSAIDLTFQPGTDLYAARQMVQERMTQAHALPNVGSPPIMIQPLASVGRAAMIRLSSRTVSLIDLSVLARWKIRPRLMGVHGVANVFVYGQRDRQLQIQVDPKRLHSQNVTLTQVIQTAGNALWVSPLTFVEASTPGTGGFYESANQRIAIQHVSPISTPRQLSAVPVEGERSGKLRLGDVASVIVDHQPLIGDAAGAPSLLLVVEKFPGADTLQVTRDVEAAMAAMAPGLKGVSIDTAEYRPATFIETALRNIGWAALIGFALLLLALWVFASWRTALIGLAAVPVAVMLAAYVLYLRGATFTTITVLALAAAACVVIDDIVTDIGAVRRAIASQAADGERQASSPVLRTALAGVRGPLLFATLAIGLATLPFLVLGTVVTAFSGPLVLSYLLAMVSSVVVAFTLTPILAALLLRGKGAARPGWFAGPVTWLADRGIAAITRPRRAWAVAGVLAVAALAVIPQIGNRSLLPQLQDRDLLLRVTAAPGTSLSEMDRITAAAGNELRALPGVRSVGTHVGRAVGSDQIVSVNSAEMWITLDSGADYGRSRAEIKTVMNGYPGLSTGLSTYPEDRVAQLMASRKDDLIVRVFGADLAVLEDKARQIRAMLSSVPGVADPVTSPVPREPTVHVQVNLAAAQRHGLRPGDVRRNATTLTSGLIAGSLYEQSEIFDVVVRGTPSVRGDLTALGNLPIDTPSGGQVPLKEVATVTVRPEPTAIVHNDVLRSADVTAGITGDPSDVVAAVRSRLARLPMPYEYHVQVLGNATIRQADGLRALAYGGVVIVGVFLLMQAAVASWRRAGLMLLSLPLSLVGGVLTAPLAGGVSSTASLAGLFAILALAIRASILLGRRVRDGSGDAQDIRAAARERAVPLAQSALATAALTLPAAIAGTRPGLEFLHPLAVTMLGGLLSLVLVQAFVLPALMLVTARREPQLTDAPVTPLPADVPQ